MHIHIYRRVHVWVCVCACVYKQCTVYVYDVRVRDGVNLRTGPAAAETALRRGRNLRAVVNTARLCALAFARPPSRGIREI